MSGDPASKGLIPVLALVGSFGPLAMDMYLSALPALRHDLHTDAAGAGSTLSVFLLGMAIGQLLYGPLSDRFGRKTMLLTGATLYMVASLLCLLSHDLISFNALRLVQAMGAASGLTLSRAMVRDLFDERHLADLFSILSVVSLAAPLIAPIFGTGIILIGGWRLIFAVLAALGLVCLTAIALVLPESLPPERRTGRLRLGATLAGFGGLVIHPRFLTAALATGCVSGILFANVTGSALLLMERFGFGRMGFTIIFTLAMIGMMGGGQANRRLLLRYSGRVIMRTAGTIAILAGLAMIAATAINPYLLCTVLVVMTTCVGFMLPNGAASAMMATDRIGIASSLLGVIQFGSGSLSSALVTFAGARTAEGMALVMCGFAIAARGLWAMRERLDDRQAMAV
ncbi:multidrug effflux MFS transporter [Sphingomonas sp.]|uniref:multidrug effflux MFS transporter n=1 Tax=Sphingomonas sp. TaxID=28214 RepID=UPI0025E5D8C0|nr:multidrug effflux MFS transporter [Sphingomonas sp.]